jgi:acetyl-CoA acyltransferase
MVPMTGLKFAPNPLLAAEHPEMYTSMGLTAENVAEKYGIDRKDQDEFSLGSHQRATAAVNNGVFDPEIVPIEVEIVEPGTDGGGPVSHSFTFQRDEGPRADTSLEALAKLRPAFKDGGTVTAGNSSQMSDGAAGVIVMSRARAEELGFKPLVRFIAYAVGGVAPELMGMGPTVAVPKILNLTGISLDEISLIELNEAFAAQSLAVIRELGLNQEITNVNGGAIALGHPLGCTGAKLTTQLIYEMKRREVQFGMVTMCIGGGMGAAGIFENLN